MNIRLHEQTENDLDASSDFYESRETGIGAYFVDCLSSDIESLKIYGGTHAKRFGFFRLLSKRFPYSIYYDFVGSDIVIFGVFADKQRPEMIEASLQQRT